MINLSEEYDKIARSYLESRIATEGISGFQNREMERPTMFRMVPKNLQEKRLLDAGCGPGIHAREYVARGADVIGIDLSKEMITLAQAYCPEAYFQLEDYIEISTRANFTVTELRENTFKPEWGSINPYFAMFPHILGIGLKKG